MNGDFEKPNTEKEFKKQFREIFEIALELALKKGDRNFAERCAKFIAAIRNNEEMDKEELEYTLQACQKLIEDSEKN